MAQEPADSPFQDEHTTPRGAAYFISVEPVFEELITEAVTLIARSRPENVRQSYISQFAAAAKAAAPVTEDEAAQGEEEDGTEKEDKAAAVEDTEEVKEAKRKVFKDLMSSIKQLRLEGSDKEFEGFSNLLLSLLLSLFPPSHADFSTLVLMLVDAITTNQERTANPSLATRYAAVSTIFNSLPLPSSSSTPSSAPEPAATLRLTVLLKLISYASANDDFSIIQPAIAKLESYLVQWGFGPGSKGEEEGNGAISSVVKSLVSKGKKPDARALLLDHLTAPSALESGATSTTTSASAAALATQLIDLSLSLPDVFEFSSLSAANAVSTPSVPALKTLLDIFLAGDLAAFESFVKSNGSVLKENGLDQTALERKLKLLALAELCSKRVGELVSYEEIAKTLRLANGAEDDGEEVETWVIDAIRATLISGRLSQPLLSFHVTRAAPRSFTPEHWTQLQSRLQGWRSSLDSILDSVKQGVQISGGAGVGAVEVQQGKKAIEEGAQPIAA